MFIFLENIRLPNILFSFHSLLYEHKYEHTWKLFCVNSFEHRIIII